MVQTAKQENEQRMPVISKFYGIVIRMLAVRALCARFHAFYEGYELVVGIAPLRVIQGQAPIRVKDLVLEWAALHQQELVEDWKRCCRWEKPQPIAPLS